MAVLPTSPPDMRASNTESLYSMYSYYQLDPSTSPTASASHFEPLSPHEDKTSDARSQTSMTSSTQSPWKKDKSPATSPNQNGDAVNPKTADDYLALGISHHEANRLTESAQCFEQSATMNGGCAVGMLMWGLSLRHGWGTEKDEQRAFKWLKRAAEHAVVDLQQGKSKLGRDAIKVGSRNFLLCGKTPY